MGMKTKYYKFLFSMLQNSRIRLSAVRFLFIFMILSYCNSAYSQNRIIKGIVVDEYGLEALIGVSILINDSIDVGVTGVDGCFNFETSLPVYKLSFGYVGCERADLMLSEDCNNIEVVMILDSTYDYMSLRKINKERRKLYKQLPFLHKKAYEKGVFQSPEPCCMQEFVEWTKERMP